MIFSILLILIINPIKEIELKETSSFPIETDNFFFSVAGRVSYLKGNKLILTESKTSKIVMIDIRSQSIQVFGGNGQGPQETPAIHSLFITPEGMQVHAMRGNRISQFKKDGTFKKSSKELVPILFQNNEDRLTLENNHYIYEVENIEINRVKDFDPKEYGFNRYSLLFENKLTVFSATSTVNKIPILIFDVEKKILDKSIIIDKKFRFLKEHFPESARSAGIKFEQFFATSINTITSVEGKGLYIHEFALSRHKKPAMKNKSVVHHLSADLELQTLRISYKDYDSISFVVPLSEKEWVGFDSLEDKLILFEHI
jgi:hypothetical protein